MSMMDDYAGEKGMACLRKKTHEYVETAKGETDDVIMNFITGESTGGDAWIIQVKRLRVDADQAPEEGTDAWLQMVSMIQTKPSILPDAIVNLKVAKTEASKAFRLFITECHSNKCICDEIEAINKTIKIISSGAVAENAEKHLPSLLHKCSSLTFLSNGVQSKDMQRATMYLQDQAKRFNSRILASVAAHAYEDPFEKMEKMIKDLIVSMMNKAIYDRFQFECTTKKTARNACSPSMV